MFWIWPTVAIVLSLGAVGLALLSLYIEDWSRDFTMNTASTSDDTKSALAAYRSDLPSAELANHTIAAAGRLPGWHLAKLEEGQGVVTLRFVRSTRLLRFKDDITVRITSEDGGSILRADSKSRLGKGDLGQNPRNLRELLAALKEKQPALARYRVAEVRGPSCWC